MRAFDGSPFPRSSAAGAWLCRGTTGGSRTGAAFAPARSSASADAHPRSPVETRAGKVPPRSANPPPYPRVPTPTYPPRTTHREDHPMPRRFAKPPLPTTTAYEARLLRELAPLLDRLADDTWTLAQRHPALAAPPSLTAEAGRLLGVARRLLSRAPGHRLLPLTLPPDVTLSRPRPVAAPGAGRPRACRRAPRPARAADPRRRDRRHRPARSPRAVGLRHQSRRGPQDPAAGGASSRPAPTAAPGAGPAARTQAACPQDDAEPRKPPPPHPPRRPAGLSVPSPLRGLRAVPEGKRRQWRLLRGEGRETYGRGAG